MVCRSRHGLQDKNLIRNLFLKGADLVCVARVAIAHPDWAMHLHEPNYSPERPPFTEQHLLDVDLSPVFVDYMKKWKSFVK